MATKELKKKRSFNDKPMPKPPKNWCVQPSMEKILDELQKPTSKLKTLAGRQVRERQRKGDPQPKDRYRKELD